MDALESAKSLIAVIRETDELLDKARTLIAYGATRAEIIAVVRKLDDLVRANGADVRREPAKTGISIAGIAMDVAQMTHLHTDAVLTMFALLAEHDGVTFEQKDERIREELRRLMIALAVYTVDILGAPSILITSAA